MRRASPPLRRCLLALLLILPVEARAADAGFWQEILAATEERRHADVVATLSDVAPEVRGSRGDLLLALALAETGEPAAALRSLPAPEATADWPASVREDLADFRLRWAARAGDCQALAEAELDRPGLRVAGARCALAEGKPEAALTLLDGLDRVDAGELRAQARAEAGDEAGALAEVRTLWIERPAHPHAERWRRRLEEHPPFEVSEAERMRRAEALMRAHRFEAAVAELEGLKPSGTRRERAALLHLRGMALYRTRHAYDQAARVLARAAALKGATEASDAFHSARAYSRAGENNRAIRDYRRFARRYPRSRRVVQALYLAAWLEAREGRRRAAFAALTRLARHPKLDAHPHTREKVLWELGFQAFERKQFLLAKKHLERYGETARSALERARGLYWAGVSCARARQPQKAGPLWVRAAHAEPLGYYAVLARQSAEALSLPPIPAFPDATESADFARPQVHLPEAAAFYAELSLTGLAAEAVGSLREVSDTERIAMLLETGDAERAHRAASGLMQPLLQSPVSDGNRWLWRALYPKPFSHAVEQETTKNGLPRSLLYAHMLVESRFDSAAVSWVGARGLLQLMPRTAERVAARLELSSDELLLLNPAFNIQLGAHYLAGLVETYGGMLPPAIAAYNAGRGNVNGWLREHPGALDLWVERIPILQTRNYVRRVLGHWARYRYLDDPEGTWEPPLPERVQLPSEPAEAEGV